MPFNGAGTFTRLFNWVTDRINGIKIRADRVDAEFDGMATGLSLCITRDGQSTIIADIPLNGFRLKGLGVAVQGGDALSRDAGDGRYAQLTGANFTGPVQMKFYGEPRIEMDRGGVDQWRVLIGTDGRFYFQRWPSDTYANTPIVFGQDGSILSAQFGDLNSRIETRAGDYAGVGRDQAKAYTDTRFTDLYAGGKTFGDRLKVTGPAGGRWGWSIDTAGIAQWTGGIDASGHFVLMRTDADTYQSTPLRVQPDGNISTPYFGFLNTYIANAAATAKSEAKADSAARMDASFVTGLRLVSAGDAAWNSSGSDGYAPGSALVTGFNMGFTGTSTANGVLHCKYLQYFIPAIGWVTM